MAQLQWVWPGLKGLLDQPRRAFEVLDLALDKLQRRVSEPEEPVQLVYGTTVTPNMARGVRRAFKLTVTNGTGFTIARPSQGHNGAVVSFDVFNNSGGAMGAVTWAAEYVFLTAWVAPATGARATVTFYKAGSAVDSSWIQLAHEPALALTRIAGASGAAGPDLTLQRLTANAAGNSTTTLATVMTTTGLGPGTWRFRYSVIYQAAATTTGVDFAVNHTGTVTKMVASSHLVTSGGAAANALALQVGTNTANLVEGKAARVVNTKMGATLGVDVINANCLVVIEGILVVSATGQLELKHASSVAAASTVQAESTLELTKVV